MNILDDRLRNESTHEPADLASLLASHDRHSPPKLLASSNAPQLEAAVKRKLRGHIDRANSHEIIGWVWDPSVPTHRVRLELTNGINAIATTVADVERQGLEKAGVGDGRHAFRFDLSQKLTAEGNFQLHLRCVDSLAPVPGSPITIEVLPKVATPVEPIAPPRVEADNTLPRGQRQADFSVLTEYLSNRARAAEAEIARLVASNLASEETENRLFQPRVNRLSGHDKGVKNQNSSLVAKRVAIISESGLFDEEYYRSQLDSGIPEGMGAIEHYIRIGWLQAKDPQAIFSVRYYLFRYPGLKKADLDPLTHYVEHGSREGRDPHPLFLTKYYAGQCGCTEPAGGTWLSHFLENSSQSVSPHPIFDPTEYSRRARLGAIAAHVALTHYIRDGWRTGIDPSPLFRSKYYRQQAGWAHTDVEPYTHYLLFGVEHNLDPHPLFDAKRWRLLTKGSASQHDPLLDYIENEPKSEISPSELFDLRFYTDKYRAEFSAKGALWHYLTEGARKNYRPHPRFDPQVYRTLYMSHSAPEDETGPLEHFVQSDLLGSQRQKLTELLCLVHDDAIRFDFDAHRRLHIDQTSEVNKTDRLEIRDYPGKLSHMDGRPNVLLVAHLVGDHFFGSERSFLDMLDGLKSCDCNVFVCLPRNVPNYTNMVRRQCEHVFVFKFGWWKASEPASSNVQHAFEHLIRSHNIDVVHANTIMIRECLAAAQSCKVVAVTHARELITLDKDLVKLIELPVEGIVAEVRNRSDWIIGNSNATANAFTKPGRILMVPNTIDTESMDIANHVDSQRIRFGLISSNVPKKGLADIVEVARLCVASAPKAEFYIIGPETKYTKELRSGASGAALPTNIVFPGYAETPKDAVAQVNVVLSLSHFAESFGRTVLEAMAARRPVIAYAWGALKELVTPEETGFLAPFKDAKAVADYVQKLCENPQLIQKMGVNARRSAIEKYGLEAYRNSFRKAYSAILPGRVQWSEASLHPIVKLARRPGLKATNQPIKLAYFCWHFPVPSETFVLNELRVLVASGVDVQVFCKQIPHRDFKIDFPIQFERVNSPEDLARRLKETGRTIVHAHFTFPTVTNMVWPACEAAKIPFTFIAHAQDIFVYKNAAENRLAEIGASPWCRAMFTLSRFHQEYVVAQGFPNNKVIINPNAIELTKFAAAANPATERRTGKRVVAIHRFVEKKGLSALIRAAALIDDLGVKIEIYGYGPLEEEYKQIVAAAGLRNVTIHGALTQAEIPAVLASADLFACPSVRTETGDMDGIPTSMVESMAARVPVLVTSIAGIPDLVEDGISGIMCEPTPQSIAEAIRRYYAMDTLQVRAIIDEASRRVAKRHDAVRLVDTLRRVWQNITVDIVIVAWNNLAELRMVVDAILANTATPYHLIICDNMSRKEPVGAYLDSLWEAQDRVTVVHNNRNAMVGPGTNLAMAQGRSDHIIYVCGKEGVSFANGWEMSFVHAFDAEDIGMVGSLGYSPTYLTGDQYPTGIRLFEKFRNPDFATSNPKRIFRHIQGGLFAMSRRMVDQIGGFSDDVPHDYTDVEYSFYAESRGWRLAEADHVLALFNKSRPSLSQRFREDITVAHPVLPNQLTKFNAVVRRQMRHCNICDWYGDDFTAEEGGCPHCGCGPQDRTLFRWLSDSTYLFRRLPALCVGLEGKMQDVWAEQFQGPRLSVADFVEELEQKGRLPNSPGRMHITAIRFSDTDEHRLGIMAKEMQRLLPTGGVALFQLGTLPSEQWSSLQSKLTDKMAKRGFGLAKSKRYASSSVGYSFLPIRSLTKL